MSATQTIDRQSIQALRQNKLNILQLRIINSMVKVRRKKKQCKIISQSTKGTAKK